MIEIAQGIIDYLNGRVAGLPQINEDFFAAEVPGLMIRHDPSPYIAQQYLNRKTDMGFNFSFYSRAMDAPTARGLLESICATLNIGPFRDLFGLAHGELVVEVAPSPIDQSEDGTVTYTCSLKLTYIKEA